MQRLLIAETTKGLTDLLDEEWEIHICSNGYEAADMLKYLQPAATIIDNSLLQSQGLDFLKRFSVLIGVSSPTNERLADILNAIGNPPRLVSRHLHSLGFNLNLDGSRFLIVGIPLYAKDPSMQLHKELYPAIQALCNAASTACVERSIRSAIRTAWDHRVISKWLQYFPENNDGDVSCPSNKEFLSYLANKL